eukprot:365690-Chlamydomonas_euryale.AAC.3
MHQPRSRRPRAQAPRQPHPLARTPRATLQGRESPQAQHAAARRRGRCRPQRCVRLCPLGTPAAAAPASQPWTSPEGAQDKRPARSSQSKASRQPGRDSSQQIRGSIGDPGGVQAQCTSAGQLKRGSCVASLPAPIALCEHVCKSTRRLHNTG